MSKNSSILQRLEEILLLSERNKCFFDLLNKKEATKFHESSTVFPNEIREEITKKPSKNEEEFFAKIQQLPTNELNSILKCLYLAIRPLEVVGLKNDFSKDELPEKIYEYRDHYKKGLRKLRELIKLYEDSAIR